MVNFLHRPWVNDLGACGGSSLSAEIEGMSSIWYIPTDLPVFVKRAGHISQQVRCCVLTKNVVHGGLTNGRLEYVLLD